MHTAHKIGNTSGVSKSSSDWLNYRVFTGDVCVTFFNVPPGNKDAVTPNPLTKKKALVFTTVTISAYRDQLNTGFSKYVKFVHEFYTLVCYCGVISTPLNMTQHKTNVIGCFTCQSYGL